MLLRQPVLGLLFILSALTVTFILVRFSGDPTSIIFLQEATEDQREVLRQQLDLNESLPTQYLNCLGNAAVGDFWRSCFDSEAVTSIVMRHLPNALIQFVACG